MKNKKIFNCKFTKAIIFKKYGFRVMKISTKFTSHKNGCPIQNPFLNKLKLCWVHNQISTYELLGIINKLDWNFLTIGKDDNIFITLMTNTEKNLIQKSEEKI